MLCCNVFIELVPGHSKNYIADDKLSFNVSISNFLKTFALKLGNVHCTNVKTKYDIITFLGISGPLPPL